MQLQSNTQSIKSDNKRKVNFIDFSRAVFRKPFLPSLHNMRHVPFNDLNALEQTLSCLQFTGDDAGRLKQISFE